MTIRYNAGDPTGFGVPSGYEGADIPSDIILPPVGIEDVDKALFDTFDQEIRFTVSNGRSNESTKVPIIFASGEKWAMIKRGRALRDKTGALILPLITIRRVGLAQSATDDITGRGINQQTGELVIKRRLSEKDRAFQNLVNKLGIVNQDNVSDGSATLTTLRATGENAQDLDVIQGGLMAPKIGQNIWEVITVPSPQFFTATYEVTFWTQYTLHMNQIIEKLISSYLPTANGTLRLDSPKGYWFVAKVQDNTFTPEDNTDDYSSEERILKYKCTIKVPGYIVASQAPGVPPPIRRFISAPAVDFTFDADENVDLINGIPVASDPYAGADDPSAGFSLDGVIQQRPAVEGQDAITYAPLVFKDPLSGQNTKRYVRVTSRNTRTGEAILKPDDGLTLKIVE